MQFYYGTMQLGGVIATPSHAAVLGRSSAVGPYRWLFFFCSMTRYPPQAASAVVWGVAGPLRGCNEDSQNRCRISGRPVTRRCLNHPPTRGKARGIVWWASRTRRKAHRRDRKKQQQLYISKSRRNSSVEPDPQPPRHGDHRRRSGRQSHDEPEGGAAGFRARENFLHCRSARPSGLGEPCSAPAASSPRAAGVVVALALFARVASTPPDVEDDDDEPLRSQASSATPVGDDDEVSAACGCTTLDSCAALLASTSSSVTRGALLAAFFALRENICEITRVLHRQLLATRLLRS